MARSLSDIKQEELTLTRDWCCTVLEFMAQKNPSHQDVFLQSKLVVKETYIKKSMTGLKQLRSDIKQWADGLSTSEKEELDIILSAKHEPTLSEEKSIDLRKAQRITQAGVIKTDEEYELIERRVNELSQNALADDKNIAILNKLLSSYHVFHNH